jgi:hypothetical protein
MGKQPSGGAWTRVFRWLSAISAMAFASGAASGESIVVIDPISDLDANYRQLSISGPDNELYITQIGQGNGITATQVTVEGVPGSNVASLKQSGQDNSISVDQRAFGAPPPWASSNITVAQIGFRHSAIVFQLGNGGNIASVTQQSPRIKVKTEVTTYDLPDNGRREPNARAAAAIQRAAPRPLGTTSVLITDVPGPPSQDHIARILQQGSRNSASIHQSGMQFNEGRVFQLGVENTASIDQEGSGLIGLYNKVRIDQHNDWSFSNNNTATARQAAGVGVSELDGVASGSPGDEFYHPGGSRSAEIRIFQKNTGNNAAVNQEGLGQLAIIEQTGSYNIASITQGVGATNATAVIRQSGDYNSYHINQSLPGQYVVIVQTGSSNSTIIR